MCGIAEVSRLVLLEIVKPVHACPRFPVFFECVVGSIVQVTQSIPPMSYIISEEILTEFEWRSCTDNIHIKQIVTYLSAYLSCYNQ